VMAAIEAGKHVYSEWPLGRNTGEARQMLDAAERHQLIDAIVQASKSGQKQTLG
jgi:predicted dehydrogenase